MCGVVVYENEGSTFSGSYEVVMRVRTGMIWCAIFAGEVDGRKCLIDSRGFKIVMF